MKAALLCLAFALGATLAGAQIAPAAHRAPGWTLAQLQTLALAHNPSLAQAAAAERAMQGELAQAGAWPNPSVGYEGDQIRGGSFRGGEQGAFVQQQIVLGGKLAAAQRQARAGLAARQTIAAAQRTAIRAGVAIAYYHTLAAQRMTALRAQLNDLAQGAVTTTRQLANVGQANTPDELQAEVEAGQAALALDGARRQQGAAWTELAAVVGQPQLAPGPLAGDLRAGPPPLVPNYWDQLLSQSPAVKIATAQVAVAEAGLSRARRQAAPNLTLTGGWQSNRELDEPAGRPVGGQAFAQATIGLPIFNRNQGNVAAAASTLAAARDNLRRVQLQLRARAAPVLAAYHSARHAAHAYATRLLPEARQAYLLYLADYRQMAASYPQVLVSQRTWFRLQIREVETLDQLWTSGLQLRSFLYSGGLNSPARVSLPAYPAENEPNAQR